MIDGTLLEHGLAKRNGPRPLTTKTNPHSQLDQQPPQPMSRKLAERISALDGVTTGHSNRAPLGTLGFFLPEGKGPSRAFMLGPEFAHIHPGPDHSLHMTLPESVRAEAIAKGWAEPHPLAGQPTVSKDIVLVFAPRDESELDTVTRLATASWAYARGIK
ncbi:luciferase family protein [Leisingera sp. D0M16]|uniref:luciferase domain-containing protein n=1 Tax=Leisingera coralii TaxID=3351347 RepID=UPI003B7DEA2B